MTTAFLRVFILVTFVISAAMSGTTVVSRIPIDGELEIPNGDSATNIQITLNGGEYTALSRIDGKFTFHDVPTGIYFLDVLSIHQVFSQMKLKVSAEENIVSVVEFKYPGAMRMQASKYSVLHIDLNCEGISIEITLISTINQPLYTTDPYNCE